MSTAKIVTVQIINGRAQISLDAPEDWAAQLSQIRLNEDAIAGLTPRVGNLETTKVDKIPGKGLSTNDFTNEDKDHLDKYKSKYKSLVRSVETAVGNAESATRNANTAAGNANEKAGLAQQKAELAAEKAGLANTAAGNADDKAELANEKAGLANEKAGLAQQKAELAAEKAGLANSAAQRANALSDHPMKISEENYHWLKWDEQTEEYVDTGVMATSSPYATFNIDLEDGSLECTTTALYGGPTFSLNQVDGNLEITI